MTRSPKIYHKARCGAPNFFKEANLQQQGFVQLTELQMVKGEATKMALLVARRNLINQEDQPFQAQAQAQSLISLIGFLRHWVAGSLIMLIDI